MIVKANNKAHIADLADELSVMEPIDKARLTAFVVAEGLMRAPFPIGFLIWIVRARHGKQGVYNAIMHLATKHLGTVLDMFEQTLQHMTDGKDREDKDSVGGFSQREINMILKEMKL